jgi:hypothetical protein
MRHVAKRLAEIMGGSFVGDYRGHGGRSGPNDTLVQNQASGKRLIRSEDDLFGGLVSDGLVATKAISHRLFDMDSAPPTGWSTAFGIQVADIVLDGYSTFSAAEAWGSPHWSAAPNSATSLAWRSAGLRGVDTGPGATAFTRMPRGRRLVASARVNA